MSEKKKHCWDIHACPACHYLYCEAYKQGINCWEVKIKPCCKRQDFARCQKCGIYQEYINIK
ncbi:MAG: hypothetical protein PHW04_16000 [Candidatus Wallbacteria bacterium]|nr:hypothetical protein [Candidatus Wallbacteria bacterium]